MNINKKINDIKSAINNSVHNPLLDDAYSMNIISKIMNYGGYIPLNEKAFRPFCLAFILNEIIINKRRYIIEFGSGISTILIARLLKMEKLTSTVVSIESDKEWCSFIESRLKAEELGQFVKLIYAPLEVHKDELLEIKWYSRSHLDSNLVLGEFQYDFVIVDGPAAFMSGSNYNRYGALPYLKNNLANECAIFLDDAHRIGELKVLKYWSDLYNVDFKIYSKTIAAGYKGKYFVSSPKGYGDPIESIKYNIKS